MRKSVLYSQNFLRNPFLIRRLLGKSSITSSDTVLEVGPGNGLITGELINRAKKVISVEIDDFLYKSLVDKFKSPKVSFFNQDFLSFNLPSDSFKVFSNIPFNITASIIKKLTSSINVPVDSYLIVQSEAASKYSGIPNESLISLLLKPCFEFSIVHSFSRKDFIPVPKVGVVLLRIKKRSKPVIESTKLLQFRDFVAYVFSKRKVSLFECVKDLLTKTQFVKLCKDLCFSVNATPRMLSFKQWVSFFEFFLKGVDVGRQALVDGAFSKLEKQQLLLNKRHRTSVQ